MTEYELLSILVERRVELVSIIQWWASISVAIIAATQILERFLNAILLAIVISFYLFFTFVTLRLARALGQQLYAAFTDLNTLVDRSGQTDLMIGQYSEGVIVNTQLFGSVAIFIVIAATCGYPIWTYVQKRKGGS